nr:hypothetical protein [Tanacetum cinerariifolium]
MGSKEEAKRLKRKGLNLQKEQVKKQKSLEEDPEIKTTTKEFTKDKIKKIMVLVPVEAVYVQALQVKHPIIDWKVHSEGERSYWQIIRLGGSSACYQFFVDLLRQQDREDLNQLWALVKEYLSIRLASKWKLYDLSGVHHVTLSPITYPLLRKYSRRARIAQSSTLPTVADEPASLVRDVSEGEACPTDSGFIASQDRATIAKSSTLPYDSAPRAKEVEILRLKERVQVLEDRESVAAKQSGDDAPIKGRSINEGEAAAERISDDSEELARVLTSIDAATVLAGGIDVPTGSGSISTAGPLDADISTGSEVFPTASLIVTSYLRRKGKEVMVESDTPKKQRLQEQIDA